MFDTFIVYLLYYLGSGGLHVPNVPKFKGQEDFKGPIFHTALYDKTFKPKGKRVAVIGTGASAVQVDR